MEELGGRPLNELEFIACWISECGKRAAPRLTLRCARKRDALSEQFGVLGLYVRDSEGQTGEPTNKKALFIRGIGRHGLKNEFGAASAEYAVAMEFTVRLERKTE